MITNTSMQDIPQIITIIVNFLFCGGVISWVTLKDKKMQEREATKQKEEDTRKSRIDTEVKQFEYLSERVKFAEEHIVTLHKKMTGMQNTINNLVSRTLFAETHICLRDNCENRHPKLGTFCNKIKKDEALYDERTNLQQDSADTTYKQHSE